MFDSVRDEILFIAVYTMLVTPCTDEASAPVALVDCFSCESMSAYFNSERIRVLKLCLERDDLFVLLRVLHVEIEILCFLLPIFGLQLLLP